MVISPSRFCGDRFGRWLALLNGPSPIRQVVSNQTSFAAGRVWAEGFATNQLQSTFIGNRLRASIRFFTDAAYTVVDTVKVVLWALRQL
jgi:hypothetical protein